MRAMLAIILLPAVLALSIPSAHLDQEWGMWKSKHGRKYITEEEEEFRRTAWEATFEKVKNHNLLADQGKKNFRLEMNHFADKTTLERSKMGCLILPPSESKVMVVHRNITRIDLPTEVDWREKKCVTKPRNQGSLCGSCWAFATVGALESRYCIKHKKLVSLSEQHLVDCDKRDEACCGGLPRMAFEYVSENGIMKRKAYKYAGHAQECAYDRKKILKMKMSKFYILPEESNMQAGVAFDGPITVGFAVTEDFQLYNGKGIFDGDCAPTPNHAIVIVGYGTENGEDYWIIKNSWGAEWGDKGYGKVKRNVNQCGIGEEASTADILGPEE